MRLPCMLAVQDATLYSFSISFACILFQAYIHTTIKRPLTLRGLCAHSQLESTGRLPIRHCLFGATDMGQQLCLPCIGQFSLQWRHIDHDGVSNHQPRGCLLNRLFTRRSKKTSKLRVTGLCAGNSPGPVNSPHKGPVTRKMLPFDDVIMFTQTESIRIVPAFGPPNVSFQMRARLYTSLVLVIIVSADTASNLKSDTYPSWFPWLLMFCLI